MFFFGFLTAKPENGRGGPGRATPTLKSAGHRVPDAQKKHGSGSPCFFGPFAAILPCKGNSVRRMNSPLSTDFQKRRATPWCAAPLRQAQDMGHTYVGTEHQLLALARDDTGEAAAFCWKGRSTAIRWGGCCASRWAAAGRTRLSLRDFTPALQMRGLRGDRGQGRVRREGGAGASAGRAAGGSGNGGRILVQLGVEPPPRQRNAAGAWASSRCSSRRPGP